MGKVSKLILGAVTLWPFVYVFGFSASMFAMVISDIGNPGSGGARVGMPSSFATLIAVHLLTIFGSFGLIAFYVVNVFRNPRVVADRKVLWAVVLLMSGMIAMPIYWYLYIWSEEKVATVDSDPRALESRPDRAAAPDYGTSSGQPYVPPSEPPDWR